MYYISLTCNHNRFKAFYFFFSYHTHGSSFFLWLISCIHTFGCTLVSSLMSQIADLKHTLHKNMAVSLFCKASNVTLTHNICVGCHPVTHKHHSVTLPPPALCWPIAPQCIMRQLHCSIISQHYAVTPLTPQSDDTSVCTVVSGVDREGQGPTTET